MKSIKWKLIAMYLGLVLIVMIVSGTYILFSFQNIENNNVLKQLSSHTEIVIDQVVESTDEAQFSNALVEIFSGDFTFSIQSAILDNKGQTLATNTVRTLPLPKFSSPGIIEALAGTPKFITEEKILNASTNIVETFMSYSYPVVRNGTVAYVVYSRVLADTIQEGIEQSARVIVVAAGLAMVLTIVMGYVFANTLTVPILALTEKAESMAKGEWKQKIKVQSSDEIGQLTESFNYLADNLTKTMKEISKEKSKLEVILQNMNDGIISFNKRGDILHINTATKSLLQISKIDFNLRDFVKEYNINSAVYLDISPDFTTTDIFPIGKKFIKALFTPYTNSKNELEGLVVVLQDITEQKMLDDMRKEFVANVSHELRTPLTTIKSYTETLLDGALEEPEMAVEFLEIIGNEADRMTFLVSDLLQLSRMDNNQMKLSFSQIDINKFVMENVRQSRIHAENKNQRLEFKVLDKDKEFFITADKDRITQVFNNILTNAIKYSLEKAYITVSIKEDSKYVKIIVNDTGMGISSDDLPRIFERFYRVDKARSREMGGTGLGLAIAKEIMEIHQGKIYVESEYGSGTTMTLCFSKNFNETEYKKKLDSA